MRTRSGNDTSDSKAPQRIVNDDDSTSTASSDEDDDDLKVLSVPKKKDGTPLGRGCRVSRPISFYEESPRRITRGMARASRGSRSANSDKRRRSGEEANAEPERHARPQRAAALQALRAINGGDGSETSSSSDDDGDRDGYMEAAARDRRANAGRLRRAIESRRGRRVEVDDDAFRSDGDDDADSDIDGRIEDDTDSSDGITNVTRAEAVALTKKRGSINDILGRSKGLSGPLSGAQGVAERDLAKRAAAAAAAAAAKRGRGDDAEGNGDGGGGGAAAPAQPTAAELGDISALAVDRSITFASVGGLPSHLLALRECVLVPLLYPALVERLQLKPPRGMLFVGPPGTGKTLMARALANEGRSAGGKSITFFMRKGADILSKWVGESERQLRLLFDEARKKQPSIIFFDEIDGLAPVRHAKSDQSQAALVSTLLALLDGLDDRGQIVVIGATNRVDTIDPALRRPGRFDRELFFPLPDAPGRRHVLRLLTDKFRDGQPGAASPGGARGGTSPAVPTPAAPPAPAAGAGSAEKAANSAASPRSAASPLAATTTAASVASPGVRSVGGAGEFDDVVERLVEETRGFSGADLNALVTEATLCALRRAVPQVLVTSQRLKLPDLQSCAPGLEDFLLALRRIQPSLDRAAGVNELQQLDPVLDDLVATGRERVSEVLARAWHPVTVALRARLEATEDVAQAAARMTRLPPLLLPAQVCLCLTPPQQASPASSKKGKAAATTALRSTLAAPSYRDAATYASSLVHAFPTIPTRVVHMPLIGGAGGRGGDGDALAEFDGLGGRGAAGSILDLCSAIRRCAPCFALILGFHEWAKDAPEEAVSHVRYAFSTLTASDVCFVVPTSGSDVDVRATRAVFAQEPNVRFVTADVGCPAVRDVCSAVSRAMSRMIDVAVGGAADPSTWPQLPVDNAPTEEGADGSKRPKKKHRTPEEKAQAQQRWARIQYKRTQLRHILRSWLMTFVSNKTYSVLCEKDLDLDQEEDADDLRMWQKHTRGKRVGLLDILEKLDNSEYTSLSEYNEDIDTLHGNIHGYFSHRDPRGLKYRTRATQLRDATILNNHKIHPNLIAFTEETKEEDEPVDTSSSDNDDDEDDDGAAAVHRPKPKPRRRRRNEFKTPSRRRRKKKPAPAAAAAEDEKKGDEEGEKEEGSGSSSDEEESCSSDSSADSGDSDDVRPVGRGSTGKKGGWTTGGSESMRKTQRASFKSPEDVIAILAAALQGVVAPAPTSDSPTLSPPTADDTSLPVGATSVRDAIAGSLHSWLVHEAQGGTMRRWNGPEPELLDRVHNTLCRGLFSDP